MVPQHLIPLQSRRESTGLASVSEESASALKPGGGEEELYFWHRLLCVFTFSAEMNCL